MTNEEARKKASDIYMRWATNEGRRTEHLIESIAQALAVPAGCVRDENGVDRKVLGTLPLTADGAVIGRGAEVYARAGLISKGPFKYTNPCVSEFEGDSYICTPETLHGFSICGSDAFSTHEAASSALSSTEKGEANEDQ